jgi:hypothetical protein
MEFIGEVSFSVPSGAAISQDGKYLALRREDAGLIWSRQSGQSIADLLRDAPVNLPLVGLPDEPNGEAIAFLPGGGGYLTLSEGEKERVYQFTFSDSTPAGERPRFTEAPQFTGSGWKLQFSGTSGQSVSIEMSTNLKDWSPIGSAQLVNGSGVFEAPDVNAAFYRLATTD